MILGKTGYSLQNNLWFIKYTAFGYLLFFFLLAHPGIVVSLHHSIIYYPYIYIN